ncbi:hypothetical protein ASF92_03920 [Pedobacter sp. Leaf176]|nr:hypothetical protein ASF92_03920 [Pedobacter sp. Leaf176]
MSPRGYRNAIEASKLRKTKVPGFNEIELKMLDMAEIELKSEKVRREECDWRQAGFQLFI